MTSTINSEASAPQEVRKHPVRGAIWGFFLGLGVAMYLVLFAIIAFGDWIPFTICVAAGITLGILWALFAPAKQPKGPPPAGPVSPAPGPAQPTPSSDQVTDDLTPPDGQLKTASDDLGVNPADPEINDLPLPPPTG
jgi:hypothetical protein